MIDYGRWIDNFYRLSPLLSTAVDVDFTNVKSTALLDSSTARYKLTIRPPKKHGEARQRGSSPCSSNFSDKTDLNLEQQQERQQSPSTIFGNK